MSYFPFAGTSDYSTTSGPTSTPSQSSTIYSGTSFTIFTPSASATPALSARQTTTSVHSFSVTTTPMSSQPSEYTGSCETLLLYCQINFTSSLPSPLRKSCLCNTVGARANATTSGPTLTPSLSPSPTPDGVSVAPDSYFLPAAISAAAVLLVVVLTTIFVVVICIITHRHKTRKSLNTQRLSSVIYQSTLSDVTFKDNQFHTGKNGEVPIYGANGAVDENHNGDIRGAPHNYGALGPSESNDSVFQGTAEEPVTEGAISRPTSQASIHSNEVTSKPAHEMVTWVHPSMLNFQNCSWETTMAGTDESGHYETSLHWQHAGGPYYNLSDCQLPGEDDRHGVLKGCQSSSWHNPPATSPNPTHRLANS